MNPAKEEERQGKFSSAESKQHANHLCIGAAFADN
jgi:hypothetical protein